MLSMVMPHKLAVRWKKMRNSGADEVADSIPTTMGLLLKEIKVMRR